MGGKAERLGASSNIGGSNPFALIARQCQDREPAEKIIPNVLGAKAIHRLVCGALIRTAERRRSGLKLSSGAKAVGGNMRSESLGHIQLLFSTSGGQRPWLSEIGHDWRPDQSY
jgi:hypothetical protein